MVYAVRIIDQHRLDAGNSIYDSVFNIKIIAKSKKQAREAASKIFGPPQYKIGIAVSKETKRNKYDR